MNSRILQQPSLLVHALLLLCTLSSGRSFISSSPVATTTTTSLFCSQQIDDGCYPIHTLILCRHGDSIWNGGEPGCRETFTGWSDVPLSQKGIREAKNTGEQLKSKLLQEEATTTSTSTTAAASAIIDVCCTSILSRAQMTTHYCLWDGLFALDNDKKKSNANAKQQQQPPLYVTDYRLNERHYGALQGYVKEEVERGRYGHAPSQVQEWRRSWHAVPPLLAEDDPRRLQEVAKFQHACGGPHKVPRGESLAMVAQDRIQPFLDERLTPLLQQAVLRRHSASTSSDDDDEDTYNGRRPLQGGTALIVAHANSLRALIGTLCRVTDNPSALSKVEALKIPTGVPLALQYQETATPGQYQVYNLVPQFETMSHPEWTTATSDLPVWPLSSVPLGVGGNAAANPITTTVATTTTTTPPDATTTHVSSSLSSLLSSTASTALAAISLSSSQSFLNTDRPLIAVITETDACENEERVAETLAVLEDLIVSKTPVDLVSVRVSPTSERSRVADFISKLVEMAARRSTDATRTQTRIVVSSDWVEAAVLAKAHGIHVKESHRSNIPDIRQQFHEAGLTPPLIGTSAHSIDSAMRALQYCKPDYMFVGTCYPTLTHPEKSVEDLEGPTLPGQVAQAMDPTSSCPIFAIGGINASNCHEPVELGASGVATIRAVLQAEDPVKTVQAMRKSMIQALRERGLDDHNDHDDDGGNCDDEKELIGKKRVGSKKGGLKEHQPLGAAGSLWGC